MKKLKLLLIWLFSLIWLSSFCSAWTISDYISIAYSWQVSLSANSTTNAIDLGSAPNKTLCITLSWNLWNNNYVKIWFYGNTTNVASDSQEYWYDQVWKTVCMYANKRYFNINNPKSTTPTISYEAYFLNDLLNTNITNYLSLIDTYYNQETTISSDNLSWGYTIYYNSLYLAPTYPWQNWPIGFDYNQFSLIEKSQVNTAYCVSNNLCPQCESVWFTWVKIYSELFWQQMWPIIQWTWLITINLSWTATSLWYNNNSLTIRWDICEQCEQCQSCPIIDQEYCENNFDLISPSNCPVCSGGVSNWSSLFINNIQHLGASSIYMSIPEEISWDYSYSNSWEIMEIDVEGYNVDYDYINWVVDIQKYKPSSEDFTNIIGNLGLYLKILLFLLFAFILISWIRKPFRSKLK